MGRWREAVRVLVISYFCVRYVCVFELCYFVFFIWTVWLFREYLLVVLGVGIVSRVGL